MSPNESMEVFRILEDGMKFREANVDELKNVLEVALDRGMDNALAQPGLRLSDRDRGALATLTDAEIKTMLSVREKLSPMDLVADNNGVLF